MNKTHIFLMLLLNLSILAPTFAESEFSPTSFVNLSYGRDSYATDYYQVQLSTELENYHQISAGVGRSQTGSKQLNTRQYSIGVATSAYETFGIGTNFSLWENGQVLKSQSLRSDIYINLDEWRLGISPQFNTAVFELYNYTLSSKGVAVSTEFYGLKNIFIGGNYYLNQYANNLFSDRTQIQRDRILSQISDSTQLLITSLEKYQLGLFFGYFFNWGSLELAWTQSKAAFVDEIINSTSLISDYQIDENIGLSLIFTRQKSNINNQNFDVIDLGLIYQW